MKMIITLVGIFLTGNIIVAQKKEFREKALQEIDSLVANALEFLGKTDSVIMATGRPASTNGGINRPDRNSGKKFIGCQQVHYGRHRLRRTNDDGVGKDRPCIYYYLYTT